MIIERKNFDINNKCVIEKFIIKPPLKYGAVFHEEACFIYVKNVKISYKSPTESLSIQSTESVLLRCGNYFAKFYQSLYPETCEVYAVHFYAATLKELYKSSFPTFIEGYKNKALNKLNGN